MCGLVGGVGFDVSLMKQLISNVSRRGPDHIDSIEIAENLVFGHARLAIVDIDGASDQPMFDGKTGNWLIFNGEIYNHAEIRRSLSNRAFNSNCDTEVLLYALHELGVKRCLGLLRGMWAFAFWSAQRRELYLSRDHVGKKPLFVWSKGGKLLFGSEVKAFRPLLPRLSPHHSSVLSFLLNRTIGDSSASFFSDIRQIQPGSFEVFKVCNSSAQQIETEFFYSFPRNCLVIDEEVAQEKFNALLFQAVRFRLPVEVPYAVTLSGGLDSSAVAAIAATMTDELTAITARYRGSAMDEYGLASELAKSYPNIKHVPVDLDWNDFMGSITDVVRANETPLADGSMVAHFNLMAELHVLGIKVVITGNGGDEILAGYTNTFNHLSSSSFDPKFLFHKSPDLLKNKLRLWRQSIGDAATIIDFKFVQQGLIDYYRSSGHIDLVNDYLIQCLTNWTSPNFLWYEDRNSMWSSIENRAPFFDRDLLDFCLQIEGRHKIQRGVSKLMLREAIKGLVPDSLRLKSTKQGFHAPIESWMQRIDLASMVSDKNFREEFHYLRLDGISHSGVEMRWRVLTLFIWWKQMIEGVDCAIKVKEAA